MNARADVDADGFGGHTALFSCVVTYNAGRKDEPLARLLLERGADPNARASIRKELAFSRDPSPHEYATSRQSAGGAGSTIKAWCRKARCD